MKDNMFFENKKSKKFSKKIIYFIVTFIVIIVIFYLFKFFRTEDYKIDKIKADKVKIENKKYSKKNEVKDMAVKEQNLPTWDLTDLYSSISDPKIKEDFETTEFRINKFEERYKGNVTKLGGNAFFRAIQKYEEINEVLAKLASYASLLYSENLLVEENVRFYQEIMEKITKLSTKLVFFTLEINELPESNLNTKYSESKALQRYKPFIRDTRVFAKYQLTEDMEKLLLEKGVTSGEAWSRFFDQTLDAMVFEYEDKKLNLSDILELSTNQDENIRKKAGKVFGNKLGENIKTFAFITNILAKDKEISDNLRGFKEPISSRNLSNFIEDEVVESLVSTVKNNYPSISHRFYKLKAKMMNKEKLHYTDRNAPLPDAVNKIYTWKESVKIVMDSYNKFSPEMAEIGQKFFDNNWIDVPTRLGKRGGAFAMSTVPSVHPYLLLNYQGKMNDVTTLAHELGHGIHQYLSADQGYLMSDTPLTLAETASVFGEQLVFRKLLEAETNPEEKKIILAKKIEDMINTVIRQTAFLEFEKKVHAERREKGELPTERINEIWLEVQKESLGDVFEYNEEYKYYWAYIPHFIHSPFYVYSYVFGDCLVNSLYSTYLKQPEGFQEKYIEMLKAGGTKRYDELLKPFNLNPKDPNFWQNGLNVIIEMIDELEKLVNNSGTKNV